MIAVGVDTHKARHYAVAVDQLGQLLGELSFAAGAAGYAELQRWAEHLGETQRLVFGIEGAGSWRRPLSAPAPRRSRRRRGRTSASSGASRRQVRPHRLARRGQVRARRPERLDATRPRDSLGAEGTADRATHRRHGTHAPAQPAPSVERDGTDRAARAHRRRHRQAARAARHLDARASERRRRRARRVRRHARPRGALTRAGDRRQTLRAGAGRTRPLARQHAPRRARDRTDLSRQAVRLRPARFKHEAAFARCNGTAPVPASSGKTIRHRLSRGGDRQVNNAIHTIALTRAKHQPETRAYLDRRISEGTTKREAMRALKRHISRDLFKRLAEVPLTS
jgi:transposase